MQAEAFYLGEYGGHGRVNTGPALKTGLWLGASTQTGTKPIP